VKYKEGLEITGGIRKGAQKSSGASEKLKRDRVMNCGHNTLKIPDDIDMLSVPVKG
jgi:hypothetical protein